MVGNYENVTELERFQVIAVDGEGVWVADEDGNCWRLAGDTKVRANDDALADAYRRATE